MVQVQVQVQHEEESPTIVKKAEIIFVMVELKVKRLRTLGLLRWSVSSEIGF